MFIENIDLQSNLEYLTKELNEKKPEYNEKPTDEIDVVFEKELKSKNQELVLQEGIKGNVKETIKDLENKLEIMENQLGNNSRKKDSTIEIDNIEEIPMMPCTDILTNDTNGNVFDVENEETVSETGTWPEQDLENMERYRWCSDTMNYEMEEKRYFMDEDLQNIITEEIDDERVSFQTSFESTEANDNELCYNQTHGEFEEKLKSKYKNLMLLERTNLYLEEKIKEMENRIVAKEEQPRGSLSEKDSIMQEMKTEQIYLQSNLDYLTKELNEKKPEYKEKSTDKIDNVFEKELKSKNKELMLQERIKANLEEKIKELESRLAAKERQSMSSLSEKDSIIDEMIIEKVYLQSNLDYLTKELNETKPEYKTKPRDEMDNVFEKELKSKNQELMLQERIKANLEEKIKELESRLAAKENQCIRQSAKEFSMQSFTDFLTRNTNENQVCIEDKETLPEAVMGSEQDSKNMERYRCRHDTMNYEMKEKEKFKREDLEKIINDKDLIIEEMKKANVYLQSNNEYLTNQVKENVSGLNVNDSYFGSPGMQDSYLVEIIHDLQSELNVKTFELEKLIHLQGLVNYPVGKSSIVGSTQTFEDTSGRYEDLIRDLELTKNNLTNVECVKRHLNNEVNLLKQDLLVRKKKFQMDLLKKDSKIKELNADKGFLETNIKELKEALDKKHNLYEAQMKLTTEFELKLANVQSLDKKKQRKKSKGKKNENSNDNSTRKKFVIDKFSLENMVLQTKVGHDDLKCFQEKVVDKDNSYMQNELKRRSDEIILLKPDNVHLQDQVNRSRKEKRYKFGKTPKGKSIIKEEEVDRKDLLDRKLSLEITMDRGERNQISKGADESNELFKDNRVALNRMFVEKTQDLVVLRSHKLAWLQDIELLRKDISGIKKEMEQKVNERNSVIEELEIEKVVLQSNIDYLTMELNQMEHKRPRDIGEREIKSHKSRDLERKFNRWKTANNENELGKQANTDRLMVEELKSENMYLRSQVEHYTSEINKCVICLQDKDIDNVHEKLVEELEIKTQALQTLRKPKLELEEKSKELKEKLAFNDEEWKKDLNEKESVIDEMNIENTYLRSQVEYLTSKINATEKDINNVHRELLEELELKSQDLQTLKKQKLELVEESNEIKKKLVSNVEDWKRQLNEKDSVIGEMNIENVFLQSNVGYLTEKLNQSMELKDKVVHKNERLFVKDETIEQESRIYKKNAEKDCVQNTIEYFTTELIDDVLHHLGKDGKGEESLICENRSIKAKDLSTPGDNEYFLIDQINHLKLKLVDKDEELERSMNETNSIIAELESAKSYLQSHVDYFVNVLMSNLVDVQVGDQFLINISEYFDVDDFSQFESKDFSSNESIEMMENFPAKGIELDESTCKHVSFFDENSNANIGEFHSAGFGFSSDGTSKSVEMSRDLKSQINNLMNVRNDKLRQLRLVDMRAKEMCCQCEDLCLKLKEKQWDINKEYKSKLRLESDLSLERARNNFDDSTSWNDDGRVDSYWSQLENELKVTDTDLVILKHNKMMLLKELCHVKKALWKIQIRSKQNLFIELNELNSQIIDCLNRARDLQNSISMRNSGPCLESVEEFDDLGMTCLKYYHLEKEIELSSEKPFDINRRNSPSLMDSNLLSYDVSQMSEDNIDKSSLLLYDENLINDLNYHISKLEEELLLLQGKYYKLRLLHSDNHWTNNVETPTCVEKIHYVEESDESPVSCKKTELFVKPETNKNQPSGKLLHSIEKLNTEIHKQHLEIQEFQKSVEISSMDKICFRIDNERFLTYQKEINAKYLNLVGEITVLRDSAKEYRNNKMISLEDKLEKFQDENKQMAVKLDHFCRILHQLDISLLNIQISVVEAEDNWHVRLESVETKNKRLQNQIANLLEEIEKT